MDMTLKELERVLYFESYVVVDPGKTPLKRKELISETRYRKLGRRARTRLPTPEWGLRRFVHLLKDFDLEKLAKTSATK